MTPFGEDVAEVWSEEEGVEERGRRDELGFEKSKSPMAI